MVRITINISELDDNGGVYIEGPTCTSAHATSHHESGNFSAGHVGTTGGPGLPGGARSEDGTQTTTDRYTGTQSNLGRQESNLATQQPLPSTTGMTPPVSDCPFQESADLLMTRLDRLELLIESTERSRTRRPAQGLLSSRSLASAPVPFSQETLHQQRQDRLDRGPNIVDIHDNDFHHNVTRPLALNDNEFHEPPEQYPEQNPGQFLAQSIKSGIDRPLQPDAQEDPDPYTMTGADGPLQPDAEREDTYEMTGAEGPLQPDAQREPDPYTMTGADGPLQPDAQRDPDPYMESRMDRPLGHDRQDARAQSMRSESYRPLDYPPDNLEPEFDPL
ncbi:uncharacterized protein J4E79_011145 [Alternaria viburni]|uniref:uncharacterized protein n=1 Tax=Alternaria viburni TaxID=566460 RepID=UPI0020C26AF7|nr:uncharacterized protein J4E79_011145 [Alternaria viburni]KAI4644197.1 hypothetical protein J4E79_011145 [Alternaria viburni]